MPKHHYIGKQSRDYERKPKYFETIVTFDEIYNHTKMENIKKPNYQGSLLEGKVEKMAEEYLENPLLLRFKNRIIIGCLKKNWYIIDGQHRIEMARMLYNDHGINDKIIFCWYECLNEQEMKNIFISVNHDSMKNQYYVSSTDLRQIIREEFTGKLKEYNKVYFSKRKTETGRIRTIEELVEGLDKIDYFHKFNGSHEAYKELMDKNKEFYDISRYEINLKNNPTSFYVDEKEKIKDKMIISLRRNNFIEWLTDSDKNKPYHMNRRIKEPISAYKKKVVWKNEFGDALTGTCPISFCTTILRKGIKNGYQCGHIISEYNGGPSEVLNMRPICPGCNQSMGYKNWEDWDR
tara:strand:+ start:684 stop:1730 length:1047 start_codon:yes stop_codon:yes gene_type:complete